MTKLTNGSKYAQTKHNCKIVTLQNKHFCILKSDKRVRTIYKPDQTKNEHKKCLNINLNITILIHNLYFLCVLLISIKAGSRDLRGWRNDREIDVNSDDDKQNNLFCRLKFCLKRLDTQLNGLTNQNSIKDPKALKPTNKTTLS